MKKIISKYYFIVVVMLIIADQFFIRLLLHSDLAAGLSDFAYYLSDMMLHFLVVFIAFFTMVKSGKWQKINSKKFRWTYLFYCVLAFLLLFLWNRVTFSLFPPTRNAISYQHYAPTFTGATAFLMYFFIL